MVAIQHVLGLGLGKSGRNASTVIGYCLSSDKVNSDRPAVVSAAPWWKGMEPTDGRSLQERDDA